MRELLILVLLAYGPVGFSQSVYLYGEKNDSFQVVLNPGVGIGEFDLFTEDYTEACDIVVSTIKPLLNTEILILDVLYNVLYDPYKRHYVIVWRDLADSTVGMNLLGSYFYLYEVRNAIMEHSYYYSIEDKNREPERIKRI